MILANKNMMKSKIGTLSKGQIPYEILINKLIDSLETPEMVKNKQLPMPVLPEEDPSSNKDFKNTIDDEPVKATTTDKTNENIFVRSYAKLRTQCTAVQEETSLIPDVAVKQQP